MKRYHLTVLDWYSPKTYNDPTKDIEIECDGMNYSHSGNYQFWKYENPDDKGDLLKRSIDIAYYPINRTVITKIENIEEENN